MKKLLKKIVNFVKWVFGVSDSLDKELPKAQEVKEVKEVKAAANKKDVKQKLVVKEESKTASEPTVTNFNSQVRTFLWKPVADHSNYPVVVVTADEFKTADLHMEVVGKGGGVLKVSITNTGRANKLGHFKYARIHFRLNRTAVEFKKSAPLKVRFFTKIAGKKTPVKVMGKNHIVIKDPTKRTDLK